MAESASPKASREIDQVVLARQPQCYPETSRGNFSPLFILFFHPEWYGTNKTARKRCHCICEVSPEMDMSLLSPGNLGFSLGKLNEPRLPIVQPFQGFSLAILLVNKFQAVSLLRISAVSLPVSY